MRVTFKREREPATLPDLHALAGQNGGGAFLARNLHGHYLSTRRRMLRC